MKSTDETDMDESCVPTQPPALRGTAMSADAGRVGSEGIELINSILIPMERSTDADERRYVQRCGCSSDWCSGDETEYVTLTIHQPQAIIEK